MLEKSHWKCFFSCFLVNKAFLSDFFSGHAWTACLDFESKTQNFKFSARKQIYKKEVSTEKSFFSEIRFSGAVECCFDNPDEIFAPKFENF